MQLDFQLPIRFDLKYAKPTEGGAKAEPAKPAAPEEGEGETKSSTKSDKIYKNLPNTVAEVPNGFERPVMVHRAMLGSVERMFAILVEHFGGNWPLWLSPRQVMIVPVHRDFEPHCQKVQQKLRFNGIFVDVDLSRRTMKKSIREAQVQGKYNYIVVIGQNEMEEDTVSVRARGASDENRGVKTEGKRVNPSLICTLCICECSFFKLCLFFFFLPFSIDSKHIRFFERFTATYKR